MNILFYMDPIADRLRGIDDRSMVARNCLNADALGEYSKTHSNVKVAFLALNEIFFKRNNLEYFRSKNVKTFGISFAAIDAIADYSGNSLHQAFDGQETEKFRKNFKRLIIEKLNGFVPDLIVTWEYCSNSFRSIFPDTPILVGEYTGLSSVTGVLDVFFWQEKNNFIERSSYVKNLKEISISPVDEEKYISFLDKYNSYINYPSQINRNFIDPVGKYKKIFLYPGNFPSRRFLRESGHISNESFVLEILKYIPDDCCLVYTKHRLAPKSEDVRSISDRVIDLSDFQKHDKDFTTRLLKHVDAVINVYSNIYKSAIFQGKPIFGVRENNEYYPQYGSLKDIKAWVDESDFNDEWPNLGAKIISFISSRSVPLSFLKDPKNSFYYYYYYTHKESRNLVPFPRINDVESYSNRFSLNILLNNPASLSIEPTLYDEIQGEILNSNTKIVGFDIFDTLLCRNVVKPIDVFDLMEESVRHIVNLKSFCFPKTRVLAESLARRKAKKNSLKEVNFDQIYHEFQELTGLSSNDIFEIKKLELTFEKKLLRPRKFAKNLFNFAKRLNKKIFIASDMYFSSEVIKELLRDHGYDLTDVLLYISSEEDAVKHDGSLFSKIISINKFDSNKIIFIGDNKKSDFDMPSAYGIKSFLYPKAIDVYKKTSLFDVSVCGYLLGDNFSQHIAYIANEIFDDPYVKFDPRTLGNNSPYALGFMSFGPLVMSVVVWLINEIKDKDYKKILFSSRDSKLISEIYEYLKERDKNIKLPKGEYVYLSRKATLSAYKEKITRSQILHLYNSKLNARDFLLDIFGIDCSDKSVIPLITECRVDLDEIVYLQTAELLDFIEIYTNENDLKVDGDKNLALIKYFEKYFNKEKVALFDLGTRGTSRDVLSDLLNINIPLYLFRRTKYRLFDDEIYSYMKDAVNPFRRGVRTVSPSFYESILSDSTTTTCEGYSIKNGESNPLFSMSKYEKKNVIIQQIQVGIMEFCKIFIDKRCNEVLSMNICSTDVYLNPISYLGAGLSDVKLLSEIKTQDPFYKKAELSILPLPLKK